ASSSGHTGTRHPDGAARRRRRRTDNVSASPTSHGRQPPRTSGRPAMKTSPLTSASAGAATLVMILLAIVLAATPAHTQARPRSDGAPSATLTEHTVTVSGVERRYLMAVPSRLDPRTAVPLVLVFHGFGGSAGQVAAELGFRELAGRER